MNGCGVRGLRTVARALLCALAISTTPLAAAAQRIPDDLAQRLNERQLEAYRAYLTTRAAFDRKLDAYWSDVDERREGRRSKRRSETPRLPRPTMSPSIRRSTTARRYRRMLRSIIASLSKPEPDKDELPGLHDFLAAAKSEYGYVPAATAEREFKRRYAMEALRVGLSKAQVIDVYALETGGRGVYDMQAGIDPESRKGRPISSALGYAQLLAGNSVNEMARHGPSFVTRLEALAKAPGIPRQRAVYLSRKSAILRKMVRAAKSVPYQWGRHVALGNTPRGQGIHAINLDPDVGPWLQVIKLRGVLDHGIQAGRTGLSGPELELMNLAGPGTGLEMMTPIGRRMPTTNFFSRAAYYRNTIVREKTGAELLAALEQRMRVNEKNKGAIEFGQIFDELARRPR